MVRANEINTHELSIGYSNSSYITTTHKYNCYSPELDTVYLYWFSFNDPIHFTIFSIMICRAATRLSAIHKHFSTFTSRRCHPYDLVYPNHRFDRLRLSTIYTTSMQFRKKPLEEQNLVNPLLDRRKRMNDIKLEKNKKVLGTVDVYHNITVGELAKLFGRTMGMRWLYTT